MPSLSSLLGGPQRRGKFLVGGHLIVGVIGFIIMLAFWLFKLIAIYVLSKPLQLYPMMFVEFYPVIVCLSLIIIATMLAKYDNKYLALSLDVLGIVFIILAIVGNIVAYIYGGGFAWDCYMSPGNLGSTDQFICNYGPGTDEGPNYAFATLWFNVVFSIWIIVSLIVYLGDMVWVWTVKWHEGRTLPFASNRDIQ
jgi:hypothetical protein